ncbi:MAG: CoA transferase [Rhodospirillales bacterium]|nr:CoA transferase [Rhodospirillales bacterium]
MTGALSHVRVLDLSRILAGPWATQVLGDLGADVIKVERPGGGDDTRGWGPPFIRDSEGNRTDRSAYFLCANRNKRSVAIDITKPRGQAIVRALALESDVIVENFKVGGLTRYGLDYASIREHKPDIVYCSITGFGQDGPYSGRAGYDFMIQAMGGLMSLTGEADGKPGGGPQKVGVALADILTGLYASTAILAALTHKERTGEGQHIDLSLLDVQVATLANQALNYLVSGAPPARLGNAHPNIVPYQVFATDGGHIVLAVGNDSQFKAFCKIAGDPALADDPRFMTNAARVENRASLIPVIETLVARKSTDWWVAELEKAGVPCGPINTLDNVFQDPQIMHREMRRNIVDPSGMTLPSVASPIRLSQTPVRYEMAPPRIGEHTAQVLRDIARLSDQDIAELLAESIIETG